MLGISWLLPRFCKGLGTHILRRIIFKCETEMLLGHAAALPTRKPGAAGLHQAVFILRLKLAQDDNRHATIGRAAFAGCVRGHWRCFAI